MDCSNIIWVAAYPKSESTWLREIINYIISPDMQSMNSIPSFHKQFPEDAPVHNLGNGSARVIRTHFYPGSPRMGGYTGDCIGAITIYRHPLDILLSAINYAKLKNREDYFKNGKIKAVENIIEDNEITYYVDKFIANDGVEYLHFAGKWSEYQKKWNDFGKQVPYLDLCYEHMVADPKKMVASIFNFFGIDHDDTIIDSVIEKAEIRTKLNGGFFWKKRAYNFKQMLPQNIIDYFYCHYEDQLNYLGYFEKCTI
ncbi:sulfotransferase domain protein [Legionella pneumophila]|uniref:sulfotransferase domain-containing protein n=1 Tax=Legionella pneumophila TaxID=446 RepID=UPI0005C433B1|nr:sulfotransferase domain-containing protein [Legionella pneumophila]MCK1887570.1 sulfotransferase domain-containing protein [Legionella pneumophila]GAN22171.1 sulfotransferase domain protein [Legionella pneumophila]